MSKANKQTHSRVPFQLYDVGITISRNCFEDYGVVSSDVSYNCVTVRRCDGVHFVIKEIRDFFSEYGLKDDFTHITGGGEDVNKKMTDAQSALDVVTTHDDLNAWIALYDCCTLRDGELELSFSDYYNAPLKIYMPNE